MYDYIRFDTLGDQPVDDYGYIRFDRNCTPGKTIPCGNACRAPQNCKKKGGSMSTASKRFGQATAAEGALVDNFMASQAKKKARSASAQKAAATRASKPKVPKGVFGADQTTPYEAALVDDYMASRSKKKATAAKRSQGAKKAAATRKTNAANSRTYGTATKREADLVESFMKSRKK